MRARLSLAAVLVLLAPPAAAPARAQSLTMPKVEVDFDKEADFTAFRTYSWKDPGVPAKDTQEHTRIVWYVERELEKKGLKKAPDGAKGDLFVRYSARARETFRGTATQGELPVPGGAGHPTTSVDFQKVAEGTLVLDLERTSDEKTVWHASTEYTSVDKKRLDAETVSAVRLLLSKYPPPKQ
ncbi:MAG TPA: DUF4136 domain-containing protein [Vicinamibacteria bacterium]|nr:DUF4136 domain-containing protein [Vicinamibacteria bacterium]